MAHHHSYKVLNNIATHLITFGEPFSGAVQEVVICFTGNPGLPDFYFEFAQKIHQNTGLPICIVGHPGHEILPHTKTEQIAGHENLFNLTGAVKHKEDLIKLLPKACELHLIGHSIGAWMILEMLEQNPSVTNQIKTINLLFPTLKHISKSFNGTLFFNRLAQKVQFLALFFAFLFSILPLEVREFLINIYVQIFSIPECNITRIINYLQPSVIEKVLYLANDEMDKVKQLHKSSFELFKERTSVIYSPNDGWVPLKYMEELAHGFPEINMYRVHYDHAFVLHSSEPVADLVTDFIRKKSETLFNQHPNSTKLITNSIAVE